MDNVIWVALIGCAGSVIGSLLGVLASNKLTTYRLQELEKKVDKHNNLVERMYKLEDKFNVHEQQFKNLLERVDDIEKCN